MTPQVSQFKEYVLRPTLDYLGMPDADRLETLLLGTAVHESAGLQFIRQVGPHRPSSVGTAGAYGIYQITGNGYLSLLSRFTGKYMGSPYYPKVRGLVPGRFLTHQWPPVEHVMGDWFWATAVARIHFLMIKTRAPLDIKDLAMYYRKYYNPISSPEDWLRHYRQYAEETPLDVLP